MPQNDYEYRKQLQSQRREEWNKKLASSSKNSKISASSSQASRNASAQANVQNKFKSSLGAARNKMASLRNRKKGGGQGKKKSSGNPQQVVRSYQKKHWKTMVAFAIISDIFDGTWLASFVTKPIILLFLRSCGENANSKIKDRIRKRKIFTFFEFIPLVNIFVLSTWMVLATWNEMHKEYMMAKKQLETGNVGREDEDDDETE